MGKEGKISRIISPLVGSYLTYAALTKGKETAPGQITVSELKKAWKNLK
jgi:3-dehydroquinate dehydratase type I